MPKPIKKPLWMTGYLGPEVVEPSLGKRADGWNPDERPPAEIMNFLFQNLSDWVDYLDEVGSQLSAFLDIYAAIVSPTSNLATHETLADALADPLVVPGSKILVIDDITLDTTVQVTKNFIEIEFHNKVEITKGAAAIGIQVTALNCKITGGRFINWTTAAIKIDAASKNARVREATFVNCTVEVDDLAPNTTLLGNITEE